MGDIDKLLGMSPQERSKLRWNDPVVDTLGARLEKHHGLPDGALRAIKYAENRGMEHDSHAVSPAGARGMMQFMPATVEKFPHDVTDPVANMNAAALYLKATLTKQYKGNIVAAFADYNGGPKQAKRVMQGKKPAAAETKGYLEKIAEYYASHHKTKGPAK